MATERHTQNRVIELFTKQLNYRYLGDWKDRPDNRNIEPEILKHWLAKQGVNETLINKALYDLDKASAIGDGRNLYDANKEVYSKLRYGVKVREGAGDNYQTVWLINWKEPEKNDFAIAEEVTVLGKYNKRPDIVLYVNGIALAILELKRSSVTLENGIRQNLDNQKKEFIRPFFTTMQLVMAGNDTQGLRYGTIETQEKYYLKWKASSDIANLLDRDLTQLCNKKRFLELIHDFIVFDKGIKKVSRHNQYYGVKAAQDHVKKREGGIIWHTQGSGKSLIMVWLAKWIRENVTNTRVLIITDRTELDEQIEGVFFGIDEEIYRTKSGSDLMDNLNSTKPWLICSLIHKFGRTEDQAMEQYIAELNKFLKKDFKPKGELFVFIDECHRTQSGILHKAMKEILPNSMSIGFTGTPLLRTDKQMSIETFGPYIHTYKYDEAVNDKVVLDLCYEARDIDQSLTSKDKIDQWFKAKTRNLTDVAKFQLKQKWGTMQKILSSQNRLEKIVADILLDMALKPRLMNGGGNAMLVCSSIYQACKVFELFTKTDLAGRCAIITSYKPSPADIKLEESGEGMTEKLRQYEIYRKMLADYFDESADKAMSKVEKFEEEVKKRFVDEPGQMRLLIVVDKLLTGFDAPSATYLYIDKSMHDHGLFQAICRVNRLDGEDKEYGYIIDYKDLFNSLCGALNDYTGDAFAGYDKEDVAGLLSDRLEKGKERLDEVREAVKALCEPVAMPRNISDYIHYFCSLPEDDKDALKKNESKRVVLYKLVASFIRAYANLANEMKDAGYNDEEIKTIKEEVTYYSKVREEIKIASGDYLDMKRFEPAMRHLLDTYVQADESKKISEFEELGLVELIVENGLDGLNKLPKSIRDNQEAMADTIENNFRKVIIDEYSTNPAYYENLSKLLEALIKERKEQALRYEEYLERIKELAERLKKPEKTSGYPTSMNTPAQRALYDNLDKNEELAIRIDTVVRHTVREGFRSNRFKQREVRSAIRQELGGDSAEDSLVEAIFELVVNQHEY